MSSLRTHFVQQLRKHLIQAVESARKMEAEAAESARTVATEAEKKEDARVMLEYGSLAKGHAARAREANDNLALLDALIRRGVPDFSARSAAGLGAMVEVATEDDKGPLERTFIMLPVGGATDLEGPGGDGFVTVITPGSSVGKALMGRRAGDVIDVMVKGDSYEWRILEVC